MNLRDLEYVCAVDDHGHFGRAAEACHVSQPTLSAQIKKLEGDLEIELFERRRGHVTRTPAGEDILPIAREILGAAREIELTAQRFRDPEAGRLHLGLIPTIAPYLIPVVVEPLRERYPNLDVVFVEDTTDGLLGRLDRGELDAAVLATAHDELALAEYPLYREPFWFALPSGHPWSRRGAIDPGDIPSEELLLLQDGHCLRDQALDVCGASAGRAHADTSATSLETLVNLVAAGLGVTLVPALAMDVAERARGVAVCRARDAKAARDVRLVHRSSFPRAELVRDMSRVIARAIPPGIVKRPSKRRPDDASS